MFTLFSNLLNNLITLHNLKIATCYKFSNFIYFAIFIPLSNISTLPIKDLVLAEVMNFCLYIFYLI